MSSLERGNVNMKGIHFCLIVAFSIASRRLATGRGSHRLWWALINNVMASLATCLCNFLRNQKWNQHSPALGQNAIASLVMPWDHFWLHGKWYQYAGALFVTPHFPFIVHPLPSYSISWMAWDNKDCLRPSCHFKSRSTLSTHSKFVSKFLNAFQSSWSPLDVFCSDDDKYIASCRI